MSCPAFSVTACEKMTYVQYTEIGDSRFLDPYSLLFSINNKNNMIKSNIDRKNSYAVHEEEGYHHAKTYKRDRRPYLVDDDSGSSS